MLYYYKNYIFYLIDLFITGNLLDVIEAPENNVMNETMAINAIQKTLMLCESVVNSTSSSITMSGTPPAYSTAVSFLLQLGHLFWINFAVFL